MLINIQGAHGHYHPNLVLNTKEVGTRLFIGNDKGQDFIVINLVVEFGCSELFGMEGNKLEVVGGVLFQKDNSKREARGISFNNVWMHAFMVCRCWSIDEGCLSS